MLVGGFSSGGGGSTIRCACDSNDVAGSGGFLRQTTVYIASFERSNSGRSSSSGASGSSSSSSSAYNRDHLRPRDCDGERARLRLCGQLRTERGSMLRRLGSPARRGGGLLGLGWNGVWPGLSMVELDAFGMVDPSKSECEVLMCPGS